MKQSNEPEIVDEYVPDFALDDAVFFDDLPRGDADREPVVKENLTTEEPNEGVVKENLTTGNEDKQ